MFVDPSQLSSPRCERAGTSRGGQAGLGGPEHRTELV